MSTLGALCGAGSAANIPAVLETLVRGLEAGSLVARCRCAEVRACHFSAVCQLTQQQTLHQRQQTQCPASGSA